MFYVYAHRTSDTGEIFYIGKGTKRRAYAKSGRNNLWHKIVNKHGFQVEILLDNLDEGTSFIQEVLAIKEYQPRANFTLGGEGVKRYGWKHTEETKQKIKASNLGKRKYADGKHGMLGKIQTVESNIKNAKSNGTTPYFAIDSSGNKYGPFYYRRQAALALNIPSSPNIGSVLSGKLKHYKGYKFVAAEVLFG